MLAYADAYSASDVLSHELCRSSMAEANEDALAAIVLDGEWLGAIVSQTLVGMVSSYRHGSSTGKRVV